MRARVNMRGSGITGQTSQDFIADTDWRHNEKSVYKEGCNVIDKSKLVCRITGRRSLYFIAETRFKEEYFCLDHDTNDQMGKIKVITQTLCQTV